MRTYTATFFRKNPLKNGKDTFQSKFEAESYTWAKILADQRAKKMGARLHTITTTATVRVKVLDTFGKICLHEIKGLKEGIILEGIYTPENKAFDFTWNGEPAMLWVGSNAEILLDK